MQPNPRYRKGIGEIYHLGKFIKPGSPIGRIPLWIFHKIQVGATSIWNFRQDPNWDWRDPRWDPAWKVFSRVGNYLKIEVGSQVELVGSWLSSRLGCAFAGGKLLGI